MSQAPALGHAARDEDGKIFLMSTPPPFVVLVPIKPPAVGKSRLATMPDQQRISLATAFARDTIAASVAASGVAQVMVVTDDHRFAAVAHADGCWCCRTRSR